MTDTKTTWKIELVNGSTEYISAPKFRIETAIEAFQFYETDCEGVKHTQAFFLRNAVLSIVKLHK